VFHGLTAYNYLKGIPATVTTHNIGSVDSIGVALYCRQELFAEGTEVVPIQSGS
jgi:ATP-dependent protease ClpP protease subunit